MYNCGSCLLVDELDQDLSKIIWSFNKEGTIFITQYRCTHTSLYVAYAHSTLYQLYEHYERYSNV